MGKVALQPNHKEDKSIVLFFVLFISKKKTGEIFSLQFFFLSVRGLRAIPSDLLPASSCVISSCLYGLLLFGAKNDRAHRFEPFLVCDTEAVAVFVVHAEVGTDDFIGGLQAELVVGWKFIFVDPADILRIPQTVVDHFPVSGFDVAVYISKEGKTVSFFTGQEGAEIHPYVVFLAEETVSVDVFGTDEYPLEADGSFLLVNTFYAAFERTP